MVMFNSINFPLHPISDVQPFTYRDSRSFLDLFEQFREYLNDTVITGVNDAVKGLIKNYQAAIDKFQELYGEDVKRLENLIAQFKTDTQAIVDTINIKSGMIDVQHLNLTNDAVINLNVTWPKNLPVLYVITQDSFGNHNVTMGNDITGSPIKGTPFISKKPLSVTFLYLMPISGTGSFFAYTSDDAFHANFIDPTSNTRKDFDSFAIPINQSITQITTDYKAADTEIKNLLNTNVTNINNAIASRYTKSESNTLFEPNELLQTEMVAFGSSQTVSGKFPDIFAGRNNLNLHNYSIGGGGYTWADGVPGKFLEQLKTAIADKTYDKSKVKYVFVCDTGNDTRGLYSILGDALNLMPVLVSTFPVSRIIIIPAMWSRANPNLNHDAMRQVLVNYDELKTAALGWPVEVIPNSWLWHWDSFDWIESNGGVHYTPAGDRRVCYFVEKYLRGEDMSMDTGPIRMGAAPGRPISAENIFTRREGQNCHMFGRFTSLGDLGPDLEILTIAPGHCPMATYRFVGTNSSKEPQTFYINPDLRAVRTLQPVKTNEVYDINIVLPIFGGMS